MLINQIKPTPDKFDIVQLPLDHRLEANAHLGVLVNIEATFKVETQHLTGVALMCKVISSDDEVIKAEVVGVGVYEHPVDMIGIRTPFDNYKISIPRNAIKSFTKVSLKDCSNSNHLWHGYDIELKATT